MSLNDRITKDLTAAMKAKDQKAVRGLRAIRAALQKAATDGSGKPIDAAREVQILQKLVKQRQDSLEIYEKQGREDLAAVEREEIEVISRYLPKMLSQEELKPLLSQIIERLGAAGMKDMGKVMGVATKELAGKATGKDISTVVRELLAR